VKYRKGYKYQVAVGAAETTFSLGLMLLGVEFDYMWARLDKGGTLHIAPGYAWDGPSGPTRDTPASIWASLCHDALYQAMRQGLVPKSYRWEADRLFYEHLVKAGMWRWRAKLWYWAVRRFGAKSAQPRSSRPILEAP
jgi:hypothetical protein